MNRSITILGSTGSIGTQTLDVIRHLEYRVSGLAAGTNVERLAQQIKEFHPQIVCVADEVHAQALRKLIGTENVEIVYGEEGLCDVAAESSADTVVTAVVGAMGIKPTLRAIQAKKNIALANKETLVSAGEIVMAEASKHNVKILPVDSEHSAIFQCLQERSLSQVKRLLLTASGGSFRTLTREQLHDVTIESALQHPNWVMGPKITIDSATLMNKGLEVMEAKWLFSMPVDAIDVVIHPQSVVHSMVEFVDHSILAQLGTADMRIPIQFALAYPERMQADWPRLAFHTYMQLDFYPPDLKRFPALSLAYDALRIGGSLPAVLNAANERVVEHVLQGRVPFSKIELHVEDVMQQHHTLSHPSLDEILESDRWARKKIDEAIHKHTPSM
ncbi:1-deoxy-D-xylulose-5-phosphate reductoisomerase [Fodinisporobacter ferrooxydans]|uniref:1-deoxy-D-xylulose 5-phosphate reductoisomerase n=1 Tax=Fodinisporobacter ferrooxydans TaxID=2901836 RepID=A0ABY4CHA0_9BACL|nr:1-deoxy-D-xylulose-5-phosphate reductoisomerase [Alicyclobacillaceae bacterium MYW30-H2]